METKKIEITHFLRPKTRGELMEALRKDIICEVVASNEEFTSVILRGWASDIKFTVNASPNSGWVLFERIIE